VVFYLKYPQLEIEISVLVHFTKLTEFLWLQSKKLARGEGRSVSSYIYTRAVRSAKTPTSQTGSEPTIGLSQGHCNF